MHKIVTLLALAFISSNLFSQKIITKKFDSNRLESQRNLKIYIPEGYEKDSLNNYPLAIVLDAEYLFDVYVANAKLFAKTDKAPKQIVVGIEMGETRKEDTNYDIDTYRLTGKNVNFIHFIRDEILPYMEGTYRTSPFVSIVGQEASANLIATLLNDKKPLFNAYICINPKFPPVIIDQIKSYDIQRYKSIDNTFYMYMNNPSFFNQEKRKVLKSLNVLLSSISAENFHLRYDDYNSPNYISAMSEAIPRAISRVFELYAGISKEEFEKNVKKLSPVDAISYLENKYLDIDFLFGSNLGIREKDIFTIEDIIIEKEDGEYLREFGNMILNVYPNSHFGDYYIGLYYEKREQYDRALASYKRAYGRMDNDDPNKELFYGNIERLNGQ